jgi:hypothetical protein
MGIDEKNMVLTARTIEGDMAGSHYEWRVVALSDKRCRMIHSAWPRNMASIVDTLDDKQQTLTVGVAVGSVLATVRGFSGRAEQMQKEPAAASSPPSPPSLPSPPSSP